MKREIRNFEDVAPTDPGQLVRIVTLTRPMVTCFALKLYDQNHVLLNPQSDLLKDFLSQALFISTT